MPTLPADWSALCALVFLLGMRHGLDADHLAAIDGLTRVSSRRRQPHAHCCGALFSLGHGAVVVSIALVAGASGAHGAPPGWFEPVGAGISIAFLLLLGGMNLRAVLRAAPDTPVPLIGVRGKFVGRLLGRAERSSSAPVVVGVGALFAFSFDTLGQAAWFAVMGVRFGGVAQALTLGLLFVLGMLLADGVNGWWIARLIDRTDRLAVVASRTMTLTVACVSLLVAALGAGRMASGRVDGWLEGKELAIGLAVIALVGLSFVMACCRGPAPAAPGPQR